MKPLICAAFLTAAVIGQAARAESPKVATDILPVQSLVAQVMKDIGTPDLIVEPGASPHGYALRPSQARALQQADIVFWVGKGLTPWLAEPIETLAPKAKRVALIDTPGTIVLERREGATFENHSHDDDGHDSHDAHEHADPHAWLDPQNAILWLDAIASELAALDRQNADHYRANAETGKVALGALQGQIAKDLAALGDLRFVVFHDAYHYFENRFGLSAAGAISLSDAADPGPARIGEIRDLVSALNVTCIFSEPQFNPALIATVIGIQDVDVATLDPLGSTVTPGAGHYAQMLQGLADSLQSCAR